MVKQIKFIENAQPHVKNDIAVFPDEVADFFIVNRVAVLWTDEDIETDKTDKESREIMVDELKRLREEVKALKDKDKAKKE